MEANKKFVVKILLTPEAAPVSWLMPARFKSEAKRKVWHQVKNMSTTPKVISAREFIP